MMQAIALQAFGGVDNLRWSEWPLPDPTIREAHRMLEAGHVTGKLVLTVGEKRR